MFRVLRERPLPETLYLDAGVFVRGLNARHRDHRDIVDLLKDAASDRTKLHTSSVIFPEVNDAILKVVLDREAGAGNLSETTRDLLRYPDRIPDPIWDEVVLVAEALEDLIAAENIVVCKADGPVRRAAMSLQKAHHLRAFDSIHVATCQRRGVKDVVCFDQDFYVVPGLTIWTAQQLIPKTTPP